MPKSFLAQTLNKRIKEIAPAIGNPIASLRKKIKNKRAYPDQSYSYNSLRSRFASGDFLLSAVSLNANFTVIDTSQKLSFKSGIQFGSTKRMVKATLGLPLIAYKNKQIKDHEVFFYKVLVGSYKARCEFHFFKGAFVVGVYTLASQVNFNTLKKSIEKKYTKGAPLEVFDKICLNDPEGNTLTITTSSFDLCLVYANRLSGDYAEMTKQLKKTVTKAKEKKSARLIEEDL